MRVKFELTSMKPVRSQAFLPSGAARVHWSTIEPGPVRRYLAMPAEVKPCHEFGSIAVRSRSPANTTISETVHAMVLGAFVESGSGGPASASSRSGSVKVVVGVDRRRATRRARPAKSRNAAKPPIKSMRATIVA